MNLRCDFCDYKTTKKFNLKRHISIKHPNDDDDDTESDTEMYESKFRCDKCHKFLSSRQNLNKHEEKCNGVSNPNECYICHKICNNPMAKSRHLKICKLEPHNSINGDNNIIGDNNTTNSYNTTTNNTTNNIIIFEERPDKYTEFIKDHITNEMITDIINKSNNDYGLLVENFHRLLYANERNRCVIKTNIKSPFCYIHVGDQEWQTKPVLTIISKMSRDLCHNLKKSINNDDIKDNINKFKIRFAKMIEIIEYLESMIFDTQNAEFYRDNVMIAALKLFKMLIKRVLSVINDFKNNYLIVS